MPAPPLAPGTLRIIAGEWRGRRVPVGDAAGLRPTPDRIRETLFNWLAPVLPGMHCLDLFAGTGALGLEALSRGAAQACFVEAQPALARALEQALARLGCEPARARVVRADALQYLAGPPRAFDLVFLDPPFGAVDLGRLCTLLDGGWLADGARIYLEMARSASLPPLPPGWELLREKEAGQVRYALARRRPSMPEEA
ncbi:MAG: 16S rRNA (guanine(966)-N(2))-methyltransferase RsmD [Gammaproteobacteria bacterium]|nr:16S rRNA (guanine(966)-N(2))-methyltransferase RsmD [Gammaproteobacteria bacterium]